MKKIIVVALVLLLAGASVKIYLANQTPSAPTNEQRIVSAVESVQKVDADASWPATPEGVITEFWKAASKKDYTRMILFCPGSTIQDFKPHYDTFTPSEAKAIGAAEPHPTVKGIMVYPVTVPFPAFPNKTIKMAVMKTHGGKIVIDAKNTIWW